MKYLSDPDAFEREINRSGLHFRSARLDTLVDAIRAYKRDPVYARREAIATALSAWKTRDPKEFGNRGATIEKDLLVDLSEAKVLLGGAGRIKLVDPSDNPKYEPWLWNQDRIRYSTNCYAYACNDSMGHPFNGKPQPGQLAQFALGKRKPAHGLVEAGPGAKVTDAKAHPLPSSEVRFGVLLDDTLRAHSLISILRTPEQRVSNQAGYYLIALVVDQDRDYHWYRQDNTGFWSHKPGHGEATNLDASGAVITDPQACDMSYPVTGIMYRFVCYYYCPRGGVRTGSRGNAAP